MAENENWAKFPPPNDKENEDDDWADFGGFEMATPLTDTQAGNNTGLISWAALSTAPQPQSETGYTAGNTISSEEQSLWAVSFQSENILSNKGDEKQAVFTVSSDPEPNSFAMAPSIAVANSSNVQEQLSELTEKLKKQTEETEKAVKLADDLKIKISVAEQEKMKFKKDLVDLMDKNQFLEIESKETKQMLTIQKQTYSDLQEKHEMQIKDIRQSGHDALVIIVEEYKELCKQVVLEQKEKNQAELHLFMENERQKFRETILQQQENFEKSLSEERSSNEERIKDVLQAEEEKHKLSLESSVSKAREDIKSGIMMIVEKTIEEGKEAVAKERELHQKTMEKMDKVLHEERERFMLSLEEALSQERTKSKIAIEEALTEQRLKIKDMVNKSVEETKAAMADYTKQKLEAASKAQQKHLVAIDLFLESARTQIKSLMESYPTS